MQRQGTNLSSTSSEDDIDPAERGLPATHVVQPLNNRYINVTVLTTALDALYGKDNWGMVTKLSYHVIIVPKKLTDKEINALQKKSARLMKRATIGVTAQASEPAPEPEPVQRRNTGI